MDFTVLSDYLGSISFNKTIVHRLFEFVIKLAFFTSLYILFVKSWKIQSNIIVRFAEKGRFLGYLLL